MFIENWSRLFLIWKQWVCVFTSILTYLSFFQVRDRIPVRQKDAQQEICNVEQNILWIGYKLTKITISKHILNETTKCSFGMNRTLYGSGNITIKLNNAIDSHREYGLFLLTTGLWDTDQNMDKKKRFTHHKHTLIDLLHLVVDYWLKLDYNFLFQLSALPLHTFESVNHSTCKFLYDFFIHRFKRVLIDCVRPVCFD